MDGWHNRPSVACASQRGAARAGAGRSAKDWLVATQIKDRRVSAVHPSDAGDIPDTDGEPSVWNGVRAWLFRPPRSLPTLDRLSSAAPESRSLFAPAHSAR